MPRRPRIEAVSDLAFLAGHLRPKTVIIPGGDREEDVRLVESARDHGIVERCILVGDERAIRECCAKVRIEVGSDDIVGTESQEETAAETVRIVQEGGADIILKGNISTPILNRAMLRIVVRNTISLVTMFDAAPIAGARPMLLTDPGVTTVCSYGRMVGLIENAVDVARSVMGIERPRVAVLSANEKVIDSLPSTRMAASLAHREWEHAAVYGPLSFDLAVSEESVALKGIDPTGAVGEVAGRADILVCPSLDSANILYKVIMETVKYGMGTFAGVTVGVKAPYLILSRADNIETKVQSIALGSMAAEYMEMGEQSVEARRIFFPAMARSCRVLVINPGASSTKLAVFENEKALCNEEIVHDPLEGGWADLTAEAERRESALRDFLSRHGIDRVDAIAARGGFLPRPKGKFPGGTYIVAEVVDGKVVVDEAMLDGITRNPECPHASNLGIPLAVALAREFGVPAYTVDPVVVDEFVPEAEVSGYAPVTRRSVAHTLSIRAAAQIMAAKSGNHVEQTNYVVAHMGSGITVAAVRGGHIVDDNIALLGEGPFSAQRVGSLPMKDLIDLCYSGRFTKDELIGELTLRGGLRSYLDEDRMEVIEERIEAGDEEARRVVEAMAYQIAKTIGSMCVAVGPDVEAIILTGGLSRSPLVVRAIKKRLTHLFPVTVLKDAPEMEALALGVCRVLGGEEEARRYPPPGTR